MPSVRQRKPEAQSEAMPIEAGNEEVVDSSKIMSRSTVGAESEKLDKTTGEKGFDRNNTSDPIKSENDGEDNGSRDQSTAEAGPELHIEKSSDAGGRNDASEQDVRESERPTRDPAES